MSYTNRRTLILPLRQFDVQVLPASVRGGKPAVRHNAMSTFLREQFRKLGGTLQKIEYTADAVRVTWLQDFRAGDPIDAVVVMLQAGHYTEATMLLRLLLSDDPDNATILYNLGMACSDMGNLDDAIDFLGKLMDIEPDNVNGRIALGVALMRRREPEAANVELQRAVEADPANPWARRNLGACLMSLGRAEDAVLHLREATELMPDDERAWYGLGQALEQIGDDQDADAAFVRVLEINEFGEVAEQAREGRTRIAHRTMRDNASGGLRMDAMFYMVSALDKFDTMTKEEIQSIAIEIALLGRGGLDINDAAQKYRLRNLPGQFSGMHLVSIMYAAFQQFASGENVGIDLSKEYAAALALRSQPSDR